jgi:hypothetical protein
METSIPAARNLLRPCQTIPKRLVSTQCCVGRPRHPTIGLGPARAHASKGAVHGYKINFLLSKPRATIESTTNKQRNLIKEAGTVHSTNNVGRKGIVKQEREALLRLGCPCKDTFKGDSSSFDARTHGGSVSRSGG